MIGKIFGLFAALDREPCSGNEFLRKVKEVDHNENMIAIHQRGEDTQEAVENLPSKAIQIQAASLPGDSNSGPHVQLFALCEDGTIWCKYFSSGFSNVPTDGRWYAF